MTISRFDAIPYLLLTRRHMHADEIHDLFTELAELKQPDLQMENPHLAAWSREKAEMLRQADAKDLEIS
jgi:hypothetical protein